MDQEFLSQRIKRCKDRIVKYEDAIDALLVGNIQSYSLDTGQTKQTVTKQNIGVLEKLLEREMKRCTELECMISGNTGGAINVGPCW